MNSRDDVKRAGLYPNCKKVHSLRDVGGRNGEKQEFTWCFMYYGSIGKIHFVMDLINSASCASDLTVQPSFSALDV